MSLTIQSLVIMFKNEDFFYWGLLNVALQSKSKHLTISFYNRHMACATEYRTTQSGLEFYNSHNSVKNMCELEINFGKEFINTVIFKGIAVADPGFPVRGGGVWTHSGGCGPPTQALFGKNVCKNKRIGSWGREGVRPARPPRSANTLGTFML